MKTVGISAKIHSNIKDAIDKHSIINGINKTRIIEDGLLLYLKNNNPDMYKSIIQELKDRVLNTLNCSNF